MDQLLHKMAEYRIGRQKILQIYLYHKPKMLKFQRILALLFQIQKQIYQLRNQVIRSDIFQMKILVGQDQVITVLKQENGKQTPIIGIIISMIPIHLKTRKIIKSVS